MTAQEMWSQYIKIEPDAKGYQAWAFGGTVPDNLANLVCRGVKSTTASPYDVYVAQGCSLPPVGGYNLILDSNNEAVCITRTLCVSMVPFNRVSKEHAYKEGEGERTLEFWRNVHKAVFQKELAQIGKQFSEEMLVVCEEFELVYPNQ